MNELSCTVKNTIKLEVLPNKIKNTDKLKTTTTKFYCGKI